MPDQLQLRGGTTTEHNSFTGVSKEVTVDTTKKTLVVHDGSTAGGTPLMREGGSNGQATVGIGTAGSNAIEISSAQDVKFIGADSNKNFFFDKSLGYVGIGNTAPSDRLHLTTTGGGNTNIRLDTNVNACRINAKVVGGENHLVLSSNNNAESVVITGSKVGIGTSSPGALLHTESTDPTIRIKRSDGSAYGEITVDTAGLISLKSDPSQQSNNSGFIFTIDNTERARLKTDGDLLLTRVTAGGASETLSISANHGSGGDQALQASNSLRFYTNGANERLRITSTGNVGIGTTSPARPLEVDGGVRLSNDAVVEWGGVSTAIYGSSGSNTLFFKTNSAERMRIDSSGNVGIGTTSPTRQLDINNSSHATLALTSTTQSSVFFADSDTNIGQISYVHGTNHMYFRVNDTERMRMDQYGSLLIGSTSSIGSNYRLQAYHPTDCRMAIANTTAASSQEVNLQFAPANSVTGALITCTSEEDFSTSANRTARLGFSTRKDGTLAERMIITSGGFVGIGGGHVEAPLSIYRDVAASTSLNLDNNTLMLRNSGSANTASRTSLYFRTHAADNKLSPSAIRCISGENYKSILAFHTNGNGNGTGHLEGHERMRINGDGKIGIATTAPTEVLDVNGAGRFRTGLLVDGADTGHNGSSLNVVGSYGDSGSQTCARFTNSDGSQLLLLRNDKAFYSDSIYHGTTSTAANVAVNSNGYVARSTSSRDYKKNIKDALWGLADVLKLRPVTFQNNAVGEFADDHTYGGFISEELHESGLTEFVQYHNNKAEGISYGHMVALLTNAIKELSAKVTALETAAA